MDLNQETVADWRGVEEQRKTEAEKCMAEIEESLRKYNCEPICIARKYYGQQVWVWAVNEIKK